MLVQILYD